MAKPQPFVHATKSRSWWTGRITALCGATEVAGQYETDTFRIFPLPGPRCPACQAIEARGGK